MSALHTYIPQDRLRALSRGESLPDRTNGAALFADISGFTQLTDILNNSLGPRRGAEELTKHLGSVYTALIAEVEKYGGSVINFAGDAITCWFEEKDKYDEAPARACVCAFALQEAMRAVAAISLLNKTTITLVLKVAVASGSARRFVVGDPTIHYMDTLAGATVARTSTAEHLAYKGDVLLDEATANALGSALSILEWRNDLESNQRFAVVTKYSKILAPVEQFPIPELSTEQLRDWLHKSQVDREQFFMTEFRPCTVLFVRFIGIDYESDNAQTQLDAFIRQMQETASRYEGAVLQLTIGDKGNYAYINFGALSSHEDDARRTVKTALALRNKSNLKLQMGIAQGVMRVGAYGGETRQTYGALGEGVNLAARLMQTAAVGEILLSEQIQKTTSHYFLFAPRAALMLKGKSEPVTAFALIGEQQKRAIRLQEPQYSLPMVGRATELQTINEKLNLTLQGKSQIIGIIAEAGMGKSRLVAEVIRAARRKGFAGYGGACQSDAINTPYQAWKSIWNAFFDVDPIEPLEKQIHFLESMIKEHASERIQTLPLLGVLLNLEIADNDFTKTLEPKHRLSTLRVLLEDCLRAAAQDEPLLIVIEDLHWIDALSHDLLEELGRALNDSRVCFVLAYRSPQLARLEESRVERLSNFTKIELHELNQVEAEDAIRAKLAQLYSDKSLLGNALPASLAAKLMARAQGNPFYLEELLNYLRDRGLDPREVNALESIALPDSLHTLILSRIDQLSEREKTTLRVASIIGRLFRVTWLTGYYPELGGATRVQSDLEQLAGMEITPLDSPEPELVYLFKHIVTHEVTYESLPFATRARLHEQLADYLEKQIAVGDLREALLLDTLVHHYARGNNHAKQREYLRKAARAAQEISAFNTAVEYLTRLVELTPAADSTRSSLVLQLADVHFRLSDFPAARAAIEQAQSAAITDTDRASALAFLAEMTIQLGDYAEGQKILAEAVPLARACGDLQALCRALSALGSVNWRLGKLDDAKAAQEESLALARTLGDVTRELFALTRLGTVAVQQDDVAEAERLFKEIYTRAVAVGNRERAMTALNNLSVVADERQDFAASQAYSQQALTLAREIGAQQSIALYLLNLAEGDIKLGQLAAARAGLREGLALALRLGAHPWVAAAVKYFAKLAYAEGQTEQALTLLGLASLQPAWGSDDQHDMDTTLIQWALDAAVVEAGLAKGATLDWDATIQKLVKASG